MIQIISSKTGISDDERRRQIFDGVIFNLPQSDSVLAFTELAWELISAAFEGHDPHTAHEELNVEEYVAVLSRLKTGFTHHPRSKELLCEVLAEMGCDLTKTYFDLPKMRIIAPSGYLNTGLGYNYKPHRDPWYALPHCLVNYWAPVSNVNEDNCMGFYPKYWSRAMPNTSKVFDYYEWNRTGRHDITKYTTNDPRPHPIPLDDDLGGDIRIIGEAGSVLTFSGTHLHASVPNTTGRARFSFDFRTVNIDDVAAMAGPALHDSGATGTTLRDFLRADTREQLPPELVALYENGGSPDGVLVFDPSVIVA